MTSTGTLGLEVPSQASSGNSGGEDLKRHVRASGCVYVSAQARMTFSVHMLVFRSMNVSTGNVCK